jgi:Uma2 family endonuclease
MTQEKMDEYLGNGARLGWLIDPVLCRVYCYRPAAAADLLDNRTRLAADPGARILT